MVLRVCTAFGFCTLFYSFVRGAHDFVLYFVFHDFVYEYKKYTLLASFLQLIDKF